MKAYAECNTIEATNSKEKSRQNFHGGPKSYLSQPQELLRSSSYTGAKKKILEFKKQKRERGQPTWTESASGLACFRRL